MHFDGYAFRQDQAAVTGGAELRRMRLQVDAEQGDWSFRLHQDLAGNNMLEGLRELQLTRRFGSLRWTVGHLKPARTLDEATSSNNLMLMERSSVSATGLFAGRQFQYGTALTQSGPRHSLAATLFNTRSAQATRNEGTGFALRGTYLPWQSDQGLLHLGAWYSQEDHAEGTQSSSAVSNYGGRRGPQRIVASTPASPLGGVESVGIELAGHHGRWRMQGEWAYADYLQAVGADQRVQAGYLQAGVLLGSGSYRYRPAEGAYGGVVSDAPGGVWELGARIDRIRRVGSALDFRSEVLGLTWYVTPGLRFMLNWTRGDDEITGDRPQQLGLRAQYVF